MEILAYVLCWLVFATVMFLVARRAIRRVDRAARLSDLVEKSEVNISGRHVLSVYKADRGLMAGIPPVVR